MLEVKISFIILIDSKHCVCKAMTKANQLCVNNYLKDIKFWINLQFCYFLSGHIVDQLLSLFKTLDIWYFSKKSIF